MKRSNPEIDETGLPYRRDHGGAGPVALGGGISPNVVVPLEKGRSELQAMACTIESEIDAVARSFEALAGHTGAILNLAAAIVGCVEKESVTSILPKVQALGATAKVFIADRLEATAGVLDTVTREAKLLHQLSEVAQGQEAIALEIKVLSVLTNIEVARLGAIGVGFQYLAHELADFSKSVIDDTQELASHMGRRRVALEETKRVLLAELPRMREELARIEADLGSALVAVDSSLTQLSTTPAQFKVGVEHIARQIAGVVAAIQRNDITRQQAEHVQKAFTLIAARMHAAEESDSIARELPTVYAGIAIQSYQLTTIKETVASWISQIRSCLDGILQVSTSEVVGIGPLVLAQEQKVSAQLVRIESLEGEGQAYSEKIQATLSGLANLMQLVSEHLQRSKSIRDRLRLLAFNSIIEASHLGIKADVILAISKSIKEVSMAWTQITNQSEQAMQEILNLVKRTNQVMEAFSPASNEKLREAQAQTGSGLDNLRNAAEFAAGQAASMQSITEKMQAKIAEIGGNGDRLEACCQHYDAVLGEVEALQRQLEIHNPGVKKGYDRGEMEELFSASYTTEMERDILRAAIRGLPVPRIQETVTGNTVELF
jgi:hypothetical protein